MVIINLKFLLKKNYPWILNRLNLIKAILVDVFVFYLLVFIFSDSILFNLAYGLNYLIYLLWIFLSYAYERYYDLIKFSKTNKIKYLFIYLIKSFFYSILILFILSITRNLNYREYFYYDNEIKFVLLFNIISLLLQLSVYKSSKIQNNNWLFIGNEFLFEIIKNDYYYKNNSFRLINFTNKDILNINDFNLTYNSLIVDEDYIKKNYDSNFFKLLKNRNIKIIRFSDWCKLYLETIPPELYNSINPIKVYSSQRKFLQLSIKRIGDLVVSFILLIITSPIILFSAIIIYLQDRGAIFYSQERTGFNGKIFRIYKLRSMKEDAEKDKAQWSYNKDQRITKFGKFIRLTRIDELPQLISVIKGEMSLIGPRPERPEIDEKLRQIIPNYFERYYLKPGLSGWAQVNYPYGASVEDAKIKLSYDLYYLKNVTLLIDLLIFFKTIRLIFNARGAIAYKFFN